VTSASNIDKAKQAVKAAKNKLRVLDGALRVHRERHSVARWHSELWQRDAGIPLF
jgi:hypothetical protein